MPQRHATTPCKRDPREDCRRIKSFWRDRCFVKAVDRLNCRATLSPATLFRGSRPKPRRIAGVGSPSLEEEIPKESQPNKEKTVMKTFVSLVVALGLATVATSSAFAGAPKNQADCEKAHMKWDATAKKCSK